MKNLSPGRRLPVWLIAALGVAAVCAACLFFTANAGENAEKPKTGNGVFLFAKEKSDKVYENVYVFFSQIELAGEIKGGVYAVFSTVTLAGAAVRTLSSKVTCGAAWTPEPLIPGRLFAHEPELLENGMYRHSDVIPECILQALFSLFCALMCLTAFGLARGFVEQGAMQLTAEPPMVIRNGLAFYLLALGIILVFSLSIVLLPFAALFTLGALTIVFVGQASFSMLMGMVAARQFKKRLSPGWCMAIGTALMVFISNIPYLNAAVLYIFMPILASGTAITCFHNGLIKKKFFYVPGKGAKPARLGRKAAKAAILNGADTLKDDR